VAERPSRRTVRPERADVRDRVLAAARETFAEVGYQRASLDAIASGAGFSKGAVYSNFASKEDLFLAVVEQETGRIRDTLAGTVTAVDDGKPDRARDVRLLAEALLAGARDGRAQLVFAEFRAHAAHDPQLAALTARVRAGLVASTADQLHRLVEARGHRLTVDARDAAVLLLALTNGLALEQVGHDGDLVGVDSLTTLMNGLVS